MRSTRRQQVHVYAAAVMLRHSSLELNEAHHLECALDLQISNRRAFLLTGACVENRFKSLLSGKVSYLNQMITKLIEAIHMLCHEIPQRIIMHHALRVSCAM